MDVVTTLRLRADQLKMVRNAREDYATDAALAKAMGIDAGNLSRVLGGKQQPGPKFIAALCGAFNADLGDLFEVTKDGGE